MARKSTRSKQKTRKQDSVPATAMAQEEAKKEKKDSSESRSTGRDTVYSDFSSQFEAAEEYQKKHRDDPYCSWQEKEALLLGRNLDSVSNKTKSQVFDPRLSTIIIERMNRVMAQHATGKVRCLDNPKDKVPTLILDLALQRYVIPNADSQYDLLTKFKLQDFYSLAYGSYVSLVDYRIDKDYIGPDTWLIPIRHFFPEANAVNDMNHCFIDTWVTRQWLESRSKETWKNIDVILEELDKKSSEKDTDQQSLSEQENSVTGSGKGRAQLIHLRTRYEADRWVTVAVDASPALEERSICRDIKNPQDNNEIPVITKHAFPLIDRFYGLGEFERGKTLQYATNSLWNLYLDGLKMRIFPPMIINDDGVVASSLGYNPGARWKETKPNSIRAWNTGSQSEQAFQSTYSALISAVMNQAGTTNVMTADVVDPGMGKTPEAIKRMGARESSRDAWDRYLMEKTVEKTFNLMTDLLVKKQQKPINFDLFEGEIKRIKSAFPDQADQMAEIFESQTYGKMKVNRGQLGGGQWKYRWYIDSGTTMKTDSQEEHQAVTEIMAVMSKIPGAMEQVGQTGKIRLGNTVYDFNELFKRHIITSGLGDWEQIMSEAEEIQGEVQQAAQNGEQLDPELQAKLDQMSQVFGAGAQQVPDQNMAGMQMGGMQ